MKSGNSSCVIRSSNAIHTQRDNKAGTQLVPAGTRWQRARAMGRLGPLLKYMIKRYKNCDKMDIALSPWFPQLSVWAVLVARNVCSCSFHSQSPDEHFFAPFPSIE